MFVCLLYKSEHNELLSNVSDNLVGDDLQGVESNSLAEGSNK